MPGNYKKRQEKITFGALVQTVNAEFAKISDQRRANATYKLTDFLRSTFAMFSLKTPSLLSFDERTKVESRNLKSIYQIEAIPSDTQMRAALGPVEPAPCGNSFARSLKLCKRRASSRRIISGAIMC